MTSDNKFSFKYILSNKISFLPLWKLTNSNSILKKYDDLNWALYNKDSAKIYKITKITKFNNIQQIILLGAEYSIIAFALAFFIYISLIIFIPMQFFIFTAFTIIAYILNYKLYKKQIFSLAMILAFFSSSIFVFLYFSSKELFYTISVYATLYICFTFTIPTLIEKQSILRGREDILTFFPNDRKGILLICYLEDILDEENSKKREKEYIEKQQNIFQRRISIIKNKEMLEQDLILKQNQPKVDKKNIKKLESQIFSLEEELKEINKEINKINLNKELENEF